MKKIIRKGVIFIAMGSAMGTSAIKVSNEAVVMEIDKTFMTLDNVKVGQELFIKD
jgi:hypothetical protein